jgi:hypothetical protein
MILDTNSAEATNIIIHKKSAVRLSNGPFSSWTPYLTLYIMRWESVHVE